MTEPILLDARMRGFPAAEAPMSGKALAEAGYSPVDGRMSLPLISLDEAAFRSNASLMLSYVSEQGVEIAPHAKTPMSPELAQELVAAGAWGATVADIRQAAVLLASGHTKLILGNEVGGPAAAKRLAAVLARYPEAELHVFVDSPASVDALASIWSSRPDLPRLGLLVELGIGRAGARDLAAANAVLASALRAETANLAVSGIAAYEGAAGVADPEETLARIRALMALLAEFLPMARAQIGDDRLLIVTAGGSLFFDLVLKALKPAVATDGHARIILRSGAIFFHDHGIYQRGLKALDARSGFTLGGASRASASEFRPALRVWAEVLSRPEPGLAIAGMGMRDVAMDQGLPMPLALYRNEAKIADLSRAKVLRLNDQHAFIALEALFGPDASPSEGAGQTIEVGDVIEFGISHPCTCLDRHRVLYALGPDLRVTGVYVTSFG